MPSRRARGELLGHVAFLPAARAYLAIDTREGVLRAYQTVEGERRDMVMYSLLAGEER